MSRKIAFSRPHRLIPARLRRRLPWSRLTGQPPFAVAMRRATAGRDPIRQLTLSSAGRCGSRQTPPVSLLQILLCTGRKHCQMLPPRGVAPLRAAAEASCRLEDREQLP
eukprot:gnl/TRDRNA2_/TRDRNA2_139395_c0_seq1.p4 gnl/TRDRNA2_/TRDRNA2_139395_c0~~gnl/TRDRNA2_/TRDRNA2_139395_c0_seq1.p4  ORF type:complete len:109 (-),score=8.07 gnl/TRDRNA2_/TRDRNA2_139395_c0_seq1:390-716(-)